METATVKASVKGRVANERALCVNDRRIVCEGKWLRVARIHDEMWLEGQLVDQPEAFLAALRRGVIKADLFTFPEAFPETEPRYKYHLESDNLAVAPTSDFKAWWEGLPQESRKNVRRAEKRGVTVKVANFDAELVRGIKGIYDEVPVRQGRRFWHYGKDLETIRNENSSYAERSRFIGAYHDGELIGFLKMVYVGTSARIMQILAQNRHADKRPMNALLSKAVETCGQQSMSCLIYGQYVYGNKSNSPVTEFKRRNGFQQVLLPRYYVPLTGKGRTALVMGLHRGLKELLPERVLSFLLNARSAFYQHILVRSRTGKENGVASHAGQVSN
jgi:hypothetical protein